MRIRKQKLKNIKCSVTQAAKGSSPAGVPLHPSLNRTTLKSVPTTIPLCSRLPNRSVKETGAAAFRA